MQDKVSSCGSTFACSSDKFGGRLPTSATCCPCCGATKKKRPSSAAKQCAVEEAAVPSRKHRPSTATSRGPWGARDANTTLSPEKTLPASASRLQKVESSPAELTAKPRQLRRPITATSRGSYGVRDSNAPISPKGLHTSASDSVLSAPRSRPTSAVNHAMPIRPTSASTHGLHVMPWLSPIGGSPIAMGLSSPRTQQPASHNFWCKKATAAKLSDTHKLANSLSSDYVSKATLLAHGNGITASPPKTASKWQDYLAEPDNSKCGRAKYITKDTLNRFWPQRHLPQPPDWWDEEEDIHEDLSRFQSPSPSHIVAPRMVTVAACLRSESVQWDAGAFRPPPIQTADARGGRDNWRS